MSKVTKAVIPAAGLGTRLSPLTRHIPKELLPMGGKPVIQCALETSMAAGICEFFIIISPEKIQLKDISIGTEELTEESGRNRAVSTIEIVLSI